MDRQSDSRIVRETGRYIDRQSDGQTIRWTDSRKEIDRQSDGQTGSKSDWQKVRLADRQAVGEIAR